MSECSLLQELPTSIGQLITLQTFGFVLLFQAKGIAYIYWPIKFIKSPQIILVFEFEGITYFYRPIE
jgi:hypothetical protein